MTMDEPRPALAVPGAQPAPPLPAPPTPFPPLPYSARMPSPSLAGSGVSGAFPGASAVAPVAPVPAEAPVGAKLCHIVRTQPGIHFRGLERAASLHSNGQLRHHIDRLARQGLLVEVKDGRFSRFFVTDGHEPQLRPGMARLARPVPGQIARILQAGPLPRTELRRRLGCADSTLGYHLARMLQAGDLERQGPAGTLYALSPAAQRVLNEAVPAAP